MPQYFRFFLPAAAFLLAACSPEFNWRQVHGKPIAFEVLLPAKPATLTRPISLGEVRTDMTMTAAEVDGVTFAVGAARLDDAQAATAALPAMKAALVGNINGSIVRESGTAAPGSEPLEVEARGKRAAGGPELLLLARFVAVDARIYQILVLGPADKLRRSEADTFLSSFKPA